MIQRSLFYIILIVFVAFSCNTPPAATGRDGVTFKTPVAYNDYIITRQLKIVALIDQFANATAVNIDSASAVLERSSSLTTDYLADIKGLSSFNGDTAFRNAAVNSFSFYKRIFEQEYRELLEINTKGENLSNADQNRAITITQALSVEEAELDKRFVNAQRDFAQKNKLQLDANVDTQKRLQENQD